jgi:small conductance mechanosensitive channel
MAKPAVPAVPVETDTPWQDAVFGWAERAVAHEWVWRGLVGLAIAIVGLWLARRVSRLLDRAMARFHVEDILRNFLRNVAYAIAVVVALVAALDFIGVPTTSLLAVIGAAGLGIGLALKDSLSNIASGVMLIVLRPFRAGDSVQVCGLEGVVESVHIFQTRLHTPDNRLIILPNSQITSQPIVNFSALGTRRVDVSLAIGYGDDVAAIRALLLEMAGADPEVLATPAPEVVVNAFEDGRVGLQLRAWAAPDAHPRVEVRLREALLAAFRDRGLGVPRPQREVHVFHHGDAPAALPDEMLKRGL